ncbi:MAG: choice-of-anchor D domain-containing protein [Alphaproteobacteria bacterium]
MTLRIYQIMLMAFILCLGFAGKAAVAQGPSAFSDPGARQAGAGGGSGLVPALATVDGGTIPVGATAQVVVRFRNDGSQPVETGLIRLYPSSNVTATISLNQCQEEPLSAGAECAIALSVKGLQAGSWRVEMLMSHSGRTRLVSSTLSGTVEATAEGADRLSSDIEAIPSSIDYGTLTASQDIVEPVILRNITSVPIKISEIAISSSDNSGFTHSAQCDELAPGQACLVTVRWSPKLRGPSSGVLVVRHNGPAGLSSVGLKGTYNPDNVNRAEVFPQAVPGRGLLVSSQTEIDFGNDVSTISTITVSLVNAGDSPLTIRDMLVAGSDSGLTIKSGGCTAGMVLDPIEACPLTLSWSPTRIGNLLDDIQILHTGARGILILPVRGESTGTVSQDQGAIVLSGGALPLRTIAPPSADVMQLEDFGDDPVASGERARAAQAGVVRASSQQGFVSNVTNPASVLDGLKITSFSPTRAIVAGPGGSRIVYDQEEVVLGGIPWDVNIQRNGIEFTSQGQTVLLLFDRSLSSINRVRSQSSGGSTSGTSSSSDSGIGGN